MTRGELKTMSGNMLVQTQHVVKRFGRIQAVNGITVEIPKGIVVGLVGPNGSGKSTFLKLLAGVLRPDSGSLRINGLPIGLETKGRGAYQQLVLSQIGDGRGPMN